MAATLNPPPDFRGRGTARSAVEGLPTCFLCARPLGRRIEHHHIVPKSRGGRDTAPIPPICHRKIHAVLTNKDLERAHADPAALRSHPEIATFLTWIQDKPPDFHAPTRRRKR